MFDPYQRYPGPSIQLSGCLALSLLLFMGCILPFLLVDMAQTALENLHLTPGSATLVLFGLILGSVVNIPVSRFPLDQEVVVPMFDTFGSWEGPQQFRRLRQECIVAVNVGGCVIPVLLGMRLLGLIVADGGAPMAVTLLGVALNSGLCYASARLIPHRGIALPPLIPVATALLLAWTALGADQFDAVRAPVAFIIGVTGPLIGADLLHWQDFKKIQAGSISIGGAGTFDGIVLSGLLAALWA